MAIGTLRDPRMPSGSFVSGRFSRFARAGASSLIRMAAKMRTKPAAMRPVTTSP